MYLKNNIQFFLKEVQSDKKREIDGIIFSNIAYVLVFIDNVSILEEKSFEGSFLIWRELKNSMLKTGKYLLFTSVSSIADDAGWDYIEVLHGKNFIKWRFDRDGETLSYSFNKNEYLNNVYKLWKKNGQKPNERPVPQNFTTIPMYRK